MTENSPGSTHPRRIGWVATTALAIGGSNQSIFLLGALLVGQGAIAGQGSAAIPLLAVGVLLAWAAAPGWTELAVLSPNRVGGIAAACTDAFRPYSPILSALVGTCYWWGWVPTCGLTALIAGQALNGWFLPMLPSPAIATAIVVIFTIIALRGMRTVARFAIPIAAIATATAFLSALLPIVTGRVDWHRATSFHLTTPFAGNFGSLTAIMAGLYIIGFAAPAFEAATCHVGETKDPERNVPRAVFASAIASGLYFIVLPIVWLGAVGPEALGRDLAIELGPTFAPLVGALGKAFAIGFLTFNMFAGTLQPIAGASRTLAQLAEDGVYPRALARRNAHDVPWVATLATAAFAVVFLAFGDPIWLIAAANFAYLIAISLPSVAVWLLRRDAPERIRPYRAPRGTIALGLVAAATWGISAIFGFEQFGLPTVLIGLLLAYSGAVLYAWRKLEDRRIAGKRGVAPSLHLTLTIAMVAVLAFDGMGYLIAIHDLPKIEAPPIAALQDIFVVVALFTIAVGLVLPGMIAESATRGLALTNASLQAGTIALQQEIAERTFVEQRLEHVAMHDDLTGLANRALFMASFQRLVERTDPDERRSAAVLFLDLDRFKLVNDSLGHLAGDRLLEAVARRLETCVRRGDVLARLGGDEFTILLADVADDGDAVAFARRVLDALAEPFLIAGRDLSASASIGIAVTRIGETAAEDILRNADIAMYRAKARGKHRYELFEPKLLAQAAGRLQLETDLRRALERREFVLAYQPIVALGDGALRGFEALLRWHHPERGIIMPESFIPVAEESGAILAIGAWVIADAARQAALWRDAFPGSAPISIGVNVSAAQFSDPELLGQIQAALLAQRLSTEYLHIEITESAIMSNPEIATQTLLELRRMDVRVQLDDFGTGYSSLGYLQRFPVDTLKIDRSFISMAGPRVCNPEIVRTIATLARSLSMTTTAEGIETREQLAELRALDCTNAQGYLFAKPLDAAEATAFIASWGRTVTIDSVGEPVAV